MSARRAYRVAYDGRPFHGFQRQPDVPTVSDALLAALRALDVLAADADVPPGYAAAGRTDAGVSALAQTVAFDAPDWLTPRAFSAELPPAIRVWAHAEVPSAFHATHDADRRVYRYHLHAPDARLERAREAAALLSGEQDLHNLTPDERGPRTRRTLSVTVERPTDSVAPEEFLRLRVAAEGFPRECVRRLASVLRGVATGRTGLDRVRAVLGDEELSGPEGVAPAAPEPLVLAGVRYPEVTFTADPDAVASLAAVFDERRSDGLVRARVAGTVRRGATSGDGDGDGDGDENDWSR